MNSYRATESEIIAIVRRLDADADQRITFNEFNEMMDRQVDSRDPVHADPTSPDRQDPYFRHTSPAKAHQIRSPERNITSPGRMHKDAHLTHASNVAARAREHYETRDRASPERSSPQKYEAFRQPTPPIALSRETFNPSPVRAQVAQTSIRGRSPVRQNADIPQISPRGNDSPLRRNSPRRSPPRFGGMQSMPAPSQVRSGSPSSPLRQSPRRSAAAAQMSP